MIGFSRLTLMASAVLGICAITAVAAHADSVSDFYTGKKLTLYIGYPPGGAYDTGARLLARHMGKHLPGNPSFVVINKPGASGRVLANELYNILPKDGSVFGTIGRNVPREQLLGSSKAKFESVKFNWLGTPSREISVCGVWHAVGIKTTQEFLAKPLILGANSGGDAELYPTVLNKLLGTKFKLVSGYPGAAEISLAMERGEVEARCGWSWGSISTERNWLKDGKVTIPLILGTGKLKSYPDIPRAVDFAKNDYDRQILEFLASSGELGRPFVAPPGVPAERVKALRDAFNATMEDKDFQADAEKQRYLLDPMPGDAMQAFIEKMEATPSNVRKAVIAILTRK